MSQKDVLLINEIKSSCDIWTPIFLSRENIMSRCNIYTTSIHWTALDIGPQTTITLFLIFFIRILIIFQHYCLCREQFSYHQYRAPDLNTDGSCISQRSSFYLDGTSRSLNMLSEDEGKSWWNCGLREELTLTHFNTSITHFNAHSLDLYISSEILLYFLLIN